jgi:glycosyltransferase involved in cell wall biosynthesis
MNEQIFPQLNSKNVAIVNEWFYVVAGAERVLEEVLRVYPGADLFALVDFMPKDQRWLFGESRVRTSFIQKFPFAKKLFRQYLPFMPLAVEQFDLSQYEAVVSLHHAVAKGALTRADQLHVSYVHTPMRYAWDLQFEYLRESKLTWGLRSILVRMILHYMRMYDRLAADRVDMFLANSHYVAQRIRKTYRREAEVVYPPVDVEQFQLCREKEDFYITASRLVPYKRIDLIVEAFKQLPDRKLLVFGDGPELKKLQSLAGKNVELRGYTKVEELRSHLQRAKAFLFAADEDFGIAPVEAQACGTPVIAFGRGGALETVLEGRTGTFFAEQTPTSIAAAVSRFESWGNRLEPEEIRQHAEQFSGARFRREFNAIMQREMERLKKGETPRHQEPDEPRNSEHQRFLAEKRHSARSSLVNSQ